MKQFTENDIKVRNELIRLCLKKGISKRKTARIFGISRQSVYDILNKPSPCPLPQAGEGIMEEEE